MISLTRFNEKSLLVVALILVWASVEPYPLVIASPLLKSSLTSSMSNTPLESKAGSGGYAMPAEYVEVEEESPITLDSLNKVVSNQPQVRMLRDNTYESRDSEDVPMAAFLSRTNEPLESQNQRLNRILEQYFLSNRANRLPRRLGATSKRAGKAVLPFWSPNSLFLLLTFLFTAAMGVDLPDYILHINKGRNFDFSSFREKMQKSG